MVISEKYAGEKEKEKKKLDEKPVFFSDEKPVFRVRGVPGTNEFHFLQVHCPCITSVKIAVITRVLESSPGS